MKPSEIECVVFDVETTGLSPKDGDRIIEIAAIKVKDKKIIDRFESFINPERKIPIEAQRINNISDDMVADAPKAEQVLPKMIEFIGGSCLVAHNIKFDMDFLCYQLSQSGRRLNSATPALDTLKLSRAFLPHLNRHRLENVAQYFGEKIDTTHRAMADVELTVNILNKLLNIADNQGIATPEELFRKYGVEKPKFKIEDVSQGTLF